ncbi:glycosyltransferase involved in cell wall biosynthesis [Pedobacter sp. UYP30]|uniref:glycosyltransferase family 2 protein n=1 Tax=Pedobacter sp. UYP30 TaxID=1756400 RepID=UPI0033917CEB
MIKEPSWIRKYNFGFQRFEEIPQQIFDSINLKLNKNQVSKPLVTVLIAAWNEEINILKNIASLADQVTDIPFEIIVVDNNSKDNTEKTLGNLNIRTYFQEIQGCGPARQMGMEHAKGKYILLADADCVYPSCWLEEMMKQLIKPGVVCVYGRYSFIAEQGFPRWKLWALEKMKDVIAELRHIKRPYLNAFGISMGYVTDFGLKVGYIMHNTRGDDGRFCFDLMQYGKVRQVKTDKARPWTAPRTLQRDGSFSQALASRLSVETKKLFSLFTAHKPHNTKKSKNE